MTGLKLMSSFEPSTPSPSDAQLREVVEKAFPETTVEVVAATAESPDAYRSDDIERAWQAMHHAAHGGEAPVLLEMLDGTWLRGEERWKAVTFLGFSLRSKVTARLQDAALRALTAEATVSHRDAAPLDTVRVQGAALDAIAGSVASVEAKWKCMLGALEPSRSHFGEIVRKLGVFRPSSRDTLAAALPALLDAMVRTKSAMDLHHLANVVEETDCRREASQLRRLLLAANSDMSANIARVLAAWGDKESIPEIRRAIDQYHVASDANVDVLVSALHSLDGERCADYVAKVFLNAPAALQEYMLGNALTKIRVASIFRTVRQVARSTSDVDLKAAAEAYLADVPAAVMDAIPIVALPGEEPAANAVPADAQSDDSGWAPKFEEMPVETTQVAYVPQTEKPQPDEEADTGWTPKYEAPPAVETKLTANAPTLEVAAQAAAESPVIADAPTPTLEESSPSAGAPASPWGMYSEPLTLEGDDDPPAEPRSYAGLITVLVVLAAILAQFVFFGF